MFSLKRYLHLHEMAPESRKTAFRFFGINISRGFSFSIADAFIILYLIAKLDYARFGVLLAIRYIIQATLDYPTGALGDIIGQKRVLMIAYLTRIVSVIFLILSNTYWQLLMFYTLDAISASQESGALESWFDNNYKLTSNDVDPNKAIFGAFHGKLGSLNYGVRAISYLVGGYIATTYSRKTLFSVYFVGVIFVTLLILRYVNLVHSSETNFSIRSYVSQLKRGLSFYVSKKSIFLYYFGFNFLMSSVTIWGLFILFPLYSSYSGSDANIGILRSILLFTGFLWFTSMAKASRKMNHVHKPLFIALFVGFPGLFFAAYLHYILIPPKESFQLLSFVTLIILFQIPGMTQPFIGIFNSRIQIKLVPNEVRNSVYSLIPTIGAIMSAIITFLAGKYISDHGVESTILLLTGLSIIGVGLIGWGLLLLKGEERIHEMESSIHIVDPVPISSETTVQEEELVIIKTKK